MWAKEHVRVHGLGRQLALITICRRMEQVVASWRERVRPEKAHRLEQRIAVKLLTGVLLAWRSHVAMQGAIDSARVEACEAKAARRVCATVVLHLRFLVSRFWYKLLGASLSSAYARFHRHTVAMRRRAAAPRIRTSPCPHEEPPLAERVGDSPRRDAVRPRRLRVQRDAALCRACLHGLGRVVSRQKLGQALRKELLRRLLVGCVRAMERDARASKCYRELIRIRNDAPCAAVLARFGALVKSRQDAERMRQRSLLGTLRCSLHGMRRATTMLRNGCVFASRRGVMLVRAGLVSFCCAGLCQRRHAGVCWTLSAASCWFVPAGWCPHSAGWCPLGHNDRI